MNRLRAFILGWRRRSAMLLDEAGCPGWLIRWRCPVPQAWGDLFRNMAGLAAWFEFHLSEYTEAIKEMTGPMIKEEEAK